MLYAQFGIVAQWPEESHEDGGSHIGLMMVPTTNAAWEWNWQSNTAEGVTIFSGGSPTVDDKVQDAVRFEGYIVSGNKTLGLPAHIGLASPLNAMHRENNALVLYRGVGLGPTTADTLNELYYIAVCPSPGTWSSTNKGLKCTVGSWQWAVNSGGQPTGVSYANTVRQNLH